MTGDPLRGEPDANHYAIHLARIFAARAEHRHVVTGRPWRQDHGQAAFEMRVIDGDDLPAGYIARIVVTVGPE